MRAEFQVKTWQGSRTGQIAKTQLALKLTDAPPDRHPARSEAIAAPLICNQAFLTQAMHQPLAATDLPPNALHGPLASLALPEYRVQFAQTLPAL